MVHVLLMRMGMKELNSPVINLLWVQEVQSLPVLLAVLGFLGLPWILKVLGYQRVPKQNHNMKK